MSSPRGWPYSASNSPGPFPKTSWIQTLSVIHPLVNDEKLSITPNKIFSKLELSQWVGSHNISIDDDKINLDTWLTSNSKSSMQERSPYLLLGELGNPFRLSDIGISGMPIIRVRLDGLARTWTDVIDNREVQPGVHHVTLVRTTGWWETALLGFPDLEQDRTLTKWLNADRWNSWQLKQIDEGTLSILLSDLSAIPTMDEIEWDGQSEWVDKQAPPLDGPLIDWSEVKVPIHTKQGSYNHRGRIARCVHYPQRKFHHEIYRKGSANQWDSKLHTKE